MTNPVSFKPLGILLTVATVLTSATLTLTTAQRASADISPLRQTGVLESIQGTHTFSGTAGQLVLITVTSDDFDSSLTVLAPDGAELGTELATSDNFGRSLNPSVVLTLPTTGDYQLIARSPYGQAGAYEVSVRVATPYDQVYANGLSLVANGDYSGAIAAFNQAIQLDPKQPSPYLDLADAIYTEATTLKPEEQEGVVSNYLRAADLYEQAGDTEMAASLREQASYFQSSEVPVP